jgi:ribose transport system ATP-binding protein
MQENILEVRGICKTFPGTKALTKVDFCLREGEVHALVGENGAGKSTLMNIIDGVLQPDEGEILVEGEKVSIKNPHEAQRLGIGFVHQEIALCQHVSVAENIFMSRINADKGAFVDFRRLKRMAAELLRPLDAEIDPSRIVGALSISNQQVVEIAKALSFRCKILILDEPTSSLTENEAQALFRIIRELKKSGIGIIYISHRMAEVFGECDRVSILRDGVKIGTYDVKGTDPGAIVDKMVGRVIDDNYPKKRAETAETDPFIFEIKDFSDRGRFADISLGVRPGEILGLFGLIGAGRSELAQAVCGLRRKTEGAVFYEGRELGIASYRDAIRSGLLYLTEDRKLYGLFLEMSIRKNISAMNLRRVTRRGMIDQRLERRQCAEYLEKLKIKSHSAETALSKLSGGNQQKVLISKLLTAGPRVIFLDEPTRGIDVGAKLEIHRFIRSMSDEGIVVVLISSELPEIVGMCDRVAVMHEGRMSGELAGADVNETAIIHLAAGMGTPGAGKLSIRVEGGSHAREKR